MNTGEVRIAVVNVLDGSIPAQVYSGRVVPSRLTDLPAVYVYIAGTNATGVDHRNVAFTTSVSVQCDVVVAENDTAYETGEQIVQAIKDILFSSETFHSNIAAFGGYTESYSTSSLGEVSVVVISFTVDIQFVESYNTKR